MRKPIEGGQLCVLLNSGELVRVVRVWADGLVDVVGVESEDFIRQGVDPLRLSYVGAFPSSGVPISEHRKQR